MRGPRIKSGIGSEIWDYDENQILERHATLGLGSKPWTGRDGNSKLRNDHFWDWTDF